MSWVILPTEENDEDRRGKYDEDHRGKEEEDYINNGEDDEGCGVMEKF